MTADIRRQREVDCRQLLDDAQHVRMVQADASELHRGLEPEQTLCGEVAGHLRPHLAALVHATRIQPVPRVITQPGADAGRALATRRRWCREVNGPRRTWRVRCDGRKLVALVQLACSATLELSTRRLRQQTLANEHHVVHRHAERIRDSGAHGAHHRTVRGRTVVSSDFRDDHNVLAPGPAGTERRHGAGPNVRMRVFRRTLDVLRIEISPAHDDEVLQASGHDELPIVQRPEIAGAQERIRVAGNPRPEYVRRLGLATPISRRDTAASHPDLPDFVARALDTGLGVHHTNGQQVRRRARGHEARAVARRSGPKPARLEPLSVNKEHRRRHRPRTARSEQRRLRQSVARKEALGAKALGCERRNKPVDRIRTNRLRAIDGNAPTRQVQRRALRLGNALGAQIVREVGRAARRRTVARHRLQPANGPLGECGRRHEGHRNPRVQRLEDRAHEPHVVIGRNPEHGLITLALAHHAMNDAEVVQQRCMRQHHAAGVAGRA